MSSFWDGLKKGVGEVGSFVADIGRAIANGINSFLHLPIKIPKINTHIPGIGKIGGETLIPALARGGPVIAGMPYIVGDGGRSELFVPNSDGYVHPSVPTGGRAGGTVVVNQYITVQGSIIRENELVGTLERVVNRGVKMHISRGIV
jgi:hypothetical protein